MMKFNRTTCGAVERDILAALEGVAEKHGITIKREGGGRFDDHSFTFKLKCSVAGENGEDAGEKLRFERDAVLFGFKPEHYGREFTSKGERYRITGFNYRARSMPIQAVRVHDGAQFKFRDIGGNIKAQLDKAA
jgi:hypothetical protein